MLQDDVEQTMRQVAELIESVTDVQARKVCFLLAEMLRRALDENRQLKARVAALELEVAVGRQSK